MNESTEFMVFNCDETLEAFKRFAEIERQKNEFKERIDKAIEYIEDYHVVVGKQIERGISNSKDELLEILKGDDDLSIK